MKNDIKKCVILLSGGVDSSFSAYTLKNEGYTLHGVYLKLHALEHYHEQNIKNASRVCIELDIPFTILELQDEFKKVVYDYFVESYLVGITPNPCVVCNPNIKFKKSLEFADSIGFEAVVSGHYVKSDGEFLYKARDQSKDQSYFLYALPKEFLKRIIFPVGERIKAEIKERALQIPLLAEIASQRESQEVCFVENEYTDILKNHANIDTEGSVYDESGAAVGSHKGFAHYTIGKRKGFTVKGAHEPHYVLSIDAQKNTITVGSKEALAKSVIVAKSLNLFVDKMEFNAQIKPRYRSEPKSAHIKIDDGVATIGLIEPFFGIANGQSVVFYDGDKLLGGGVIVESF